MRMTSLRSLSFGQRSLCKGSIDITRLSHGHDHRRGTCSNCTEMAELALRKYHDSSRKSCGIFKARRVFLINIVQSDSFLCQQIDEHKREAVACELTHSRLVTIIVNVSVTFEILPVVWIAYSLLDLSQTWLVGPVVLLLYSEKFSSGI